MLEVISFFRLAEEGRKGGYAASPRKQASKAVPRTVQHMKASGKTRQIALTKGKPALLHAAMAAEKSAGVNLNMAGGADKMDAEFEKY
jgi:hypothetical protein